jgi:uncharacterized membrane protein
VVWVYAEEDAGLTLMLTIAAASFIATGVILVLVAVPMIRRRVPPNRLYGLRVSATYADEWVWYEANAASGRDMLLLGVLQLAVAIVGLLFLRQLPIAYVLLNTAVICAGAIAVAIVGLLRADRLLKRRRQDSCSS